MSKISKFLNDPNLFFIDFLQKRLGGRFSYLYCYSEKLFSLIASDATKRIWAERLMRLAYVSGDLYVLSLIFLKACRQFEPSLWAVTYYIAKAVNNGETKYLPEIIKNSCVHPDHLPLLESARLRAKGDYRGALKALCFHSASPNIRFKMAQAERSIYHIMRDKEGMAISALRFIRAEPDMILMEYALNAAGAAESAVRHDIMAACLKRVLRDIDRIMQSKKIFRQYWREAITVSLRLYRIEDAIMIARKARSYGFKKARREIVYLTKICDQTANWRWVVNAARDMVQAVANGKKPKYSGKTLVVLHSAAFSRNAIDYPGFRDDIRFCYNQIISELMALQVKPEISFKLSTHGRILHDGPYFSYHTASDDQFGCHFKETDKPHSFSFDPSGYSGWSEFSTIACADPLIAKIDLDSAEQFFASEKIRILEQNISKYKQPAANGMSQLPEKYIFIGLQIQNDAVQELAYCDIVAMIEAICQVAVQNGLKVVIKRHPHCRSGTVAELLTQGEKAGKFIVMNGNIHELIQYSQAVCVVNSAVGAEALLYEKPVYVFGKSEYMAACFICRQASDFEKVFKPGKQKLDSQALKKFYYALKNIYATDLSDDVKAGAFIKNKVKHHLRLNGFAF